LEEQSVQGTFKVCYWVVTYYGKVDDNQGLLGTWLACCCSPIYLRLTCTLAHFDYRGPLSLPACTSLTTVAHYPHCRICLAVPESNSLVPLHTFLSIVLAASSLVLMCTPTVLLALYPSHVIPVSPCHQTKAKSAKLDKVKRTIVSHLRVLESVLYCSFGPASTKIAKDMQRLIWFRDTL
jgi:hypothetical protein